ncbi:hypothetical protein N9980_01305 [bacterium]|nr:hypothetical protein [bacterium]
MSDSTSTLTGAGYQHDGGSAQQNNNLPTDTDGKEKDVPDGANDDDKAKPGEAEQKESGQGNPLTALVQNRQQNRDTNDQYQAQIAAMQQEIANLRAQQPAAPAPEAWKNPYNETDEPVDHLRAELEHTRAEMSELRQQGTAELTDSRNARALADFEQSIAQEVSMEAENTPALLQAYGFINQQMTNMHKGQGLKGRQLANAVRNSVLQAYVNGQTSGMSHTQTTAQMALNMGFQAGVAKPDPVKRGQKAADQSVGHATGAGGNNTPSSAQQLAKSSKADLIKDDRAGIKRIRDILQGNVPIE